jgi:hypothetical protein
MTAVVGGSIGLEASSWQDAQADVTVSEMVNTEPSETAPEVNHPLLPEGMEPNNEQSTDGWGQEYIVKPIMAFAINLIDGFANLAYGLKLVAGSTVAAVSMKGTAYGFLGLGLWNVCKSLLSQIGVIGGE